MKKIVLLLIFAISLSLFAQEFPIVTGAYSQTYPEASFANGQYFTVFLDKRTGSSQYEFWAKFISPEGVVDPVEHQILSPYNALSFMHHIAWGNSNYLFVWSRQRGPYNYTRDAYGILVGQDGNPIGGQFPISSGNTESCSFLKTAFDGTNYLVVWQEGLPNQGSKIRGQFVSPAGQMVGTNFDIRPASLAATDSQIYPDILFNGQNYAVAWDDNRLGNRDIYMQFVGTDGSLIGDDIAVCTHPAKQLLVQFAFSGSNYLLVWSDERDSTSDTGVYGQMVGTDGSLLGGNIPISVTTNSEGRGWPAIAASYGQYLVTWKQDFLVYDDVTREISLEEEVMYQSAGMDPADPTLWYDVWGRKVEFDGSTPDVEFPICTVDYHQDESCVATDGTDFLVAWEDSRNANQYYDIYGMIVEGIAVATGFVEGIVTLNGGAGNVEDVQVSAGATSTSPNASGFYQMELLPGSYLLSAVLEGFEDFEIAIDISSGNVFIQDITLDAYTYDPPVNMNIEVVSFNDVQISWDLPSGSATLTGYHIYRNGILIADITDPFVFQYFDPALDSGSYEYSLFAVYGDILSLPVTAEILIILPAPTNLSAEFISPDIHLSWNAPNRDLASYRVYRNGTLLAEDIFETSYIDADPGYNVWTYHVSAVYDGGWESELSEPVEIAGGVGTIETLTPSLKLIGNYPNPFNPTGVGRSPCTTIVFSINTQSGEEATLEIFNMKGEKIRQYSIFSNQSSIVWNGTDESGKPVSSGIYFYRLKSGSDLETRKMLLLR
jgi:hypothetical protein